MLAQPAGRHKRPCNSSSRYRTKRDRTYNAAEPIASGVVPGFERSFAISADHR